MRERNHNYLYTVELKVESTTIDTQGKVVIWREHQIEACNIWQVIGKLNLHEHQVRYKHKEIL